MQARKFLAFLLCLCLFVPACALASQGDRVLARKGGSSDFDDTILFQCALDDELFLFGRRALYTWRVGDEDMRALAWEGGQVGAVVVNPETGETLTRSAKALAAFVSDGELCMAAQIRDYREGNEDYLGAALCRVVFSGETVHLEWIGPLDWGPLAEEDSLSLPIPSDSACVDGILYCIPEFLGDNACAIPLDGGYSEELNDIPMPNAVAEYKDGKVLFLYRDEQKASIMHMVAYDFERGDLEELCALSLNWSNSSPSVISYDAQSDRLIFAGGGMVCSLDPITGEMADVNEMPAPQDREIASMGSMLSGGYYAITSNFSTLIKNTDPSMRSTTRLTVHGDFGMLRDANAAYYDFVGRYADVSVAMVEDYSLSNRWPSIEEGPAKSTIVEAMLTRSADADIYLAQMDSEAFDAIYSRGYMCEITGSEKINSFVASLYPAVAELLCPNGAPVAVPVYVYASDIGVNPKVLQAIGLTLDDIPTNWPELLDMLPELCARLESTEFGLWNHESEPESVRNALLSNILYDYMTYRQYTDPTMGFDTDELRIPLKKLEAIDDHAFEISICSFGFEDVPESLFAGTRIPDDDGSIVPLLLSMTPDAPHLIPLTLELAFINPYSENKELATVFLESLLDQMDKADLATLCDVDVVPERTAGYEQAKAKAQERLSGLQDALARAEQVDRQPLEEQIREAEAALEEIENGYWDVNADLLACYRAHTDSITFNHHRLFNTWGNLGVGSENELETIVLQYQQGQISLDEMLQRIDGKVQMMLLEGN